MINYYTSDNGRLDPIDALESGCWVSVIDPTPQEIKTLIDDFGLDSGFVKSSLDEEESSRIEREDDQTLIIIDTPVASTEDDETKVFYTMPIGIIITEKCLFEVCRVEPWLRYIRFAQYQAVLYPHFLRLSDILFDIVHIRTGGDTAALRDIVICQLDFFLIERLKLGVVVKIPVLSL